MLVSEIQSLHAAYLRLTERFKALWTFHQFLRGVHQTFLGDVPSYQIDFQAIYNDLKALSGDVTSGMNPDVTREQMDRLDTSLALAGRSLRISDRALSPSLVRRFFDKVRPQDEKIVYHLLRFYFSQPEIDSDLADKVDFLATLAATAPGGEGIIPRDFADTVNSFEAIVAGCTWAPTDSTEAESTVRAFGSLGNEVSSATSFEALVSDKLIENVRTLKHRLGPAIAVPKVLAAMAICNVRTKAVFRRLFEDEKLRILESSRRIEDLEKEVVKDGTQQIPEEFLRFRDSHRLFAESADVANIRAADVVKLKKSISEVLRKFDLGTVGSDEIEEALEFSEGSAEHAAGLHDVLQAEIQKILGAVEMSDSDVKPIGHMGLEPWEIRAAKRTVARNGVATSDRDQLLLEAAAIRLRAEEQAARWKQAIKMGRPLDRMEPDVRETIALAGETDRQFADFITEAAEESAPEEMSSLLRSRFRLLNAYSSLWLLHDSPKF